MKRTRETWKITLAQRAEMLARYRDGAPAPHPEHAYTGGWVRDGMILRPRLPDPMSLGACIDEIRPDIEKKRSA